MKMNKSFRKYAKYYDLIYEDKNYQKEVDFVEVDENVWNMCVITRLGGEKE